MNKHIYYALILVLFSCHNNSSTDETSHQEEIILSKEQKIINLYTTSVIPLFAEYKEVVIPTDFVIDENDLGINAGAAFGYVEISMGLVNVSKESVQLFALSHEVAHIVTLSQAKLFNYQSSIPKGTLTNDYKKAEYLADLIAIYLIKIHQPEHFESLLSNFKYLESLLGVSTFTHPSGTERINAINEYLALSKETNSTVAFKEMYAKFWNMD
ncbi:hypothetical protein Q4595_12445 [Wenyingzhuangia sp. 1_MG-2023]|nr:hypothetical protein [Wenyingzhuangia sp. 1_MG-2023]